jgi:hypothetical protein
MFNLVSLLSAQGRAIAITWVKGHFGVPGNERADALAGKAVEKIGPSTVMSIAHLKLKISERFKKAKAPRHDNPRHHGTEEIPLPPPKESYLDRARNAIARTAAAQIRTGHWRAATYLKKIQKRADNRCQFCRGSVRMTRSHVLLHCSNERLRSLEWRHGKGKTREVSGC